MESDRMESIRTIKMEAMKPPFILTTVASSLLFIALCKLY